jgi:tubulin polyglutamylase TTLL6/13
MFISSDYFISFLNNSYSDFAKYCSEKKYRTYISKPDVGCQGRGIFITKNPSKDIKP